MQMKWRLAAVKRFPHTSKSCHETLESLNKTYHTCATFTLASDGRMCFIQSTNLENTCEQCRRMKA